MKKCLITGSTGLIGSSLVPELQDDFDLFLLKRNCQEETLRNQQLALSLSDPNFADNLPGKMDCVIHLAQSERYRDFPEGVQDVFDVNVRSTLILLDYARKAGVKNFILASSGVVYESENKGIKEDNPLTLKKGNLGFYYSSKLCAEALAENYAECMNVIILRFFFVYGPGQRKSMLIPRLVQSVIDGKPLQLHGQDGMLMNPIYITDAVMALKKALEINSSEKINIAGSEIMNIRQIGNTIASCLNKEAIFDVKKDIAPQHLVGDIVKMKSCLLTPQVSFKEGINNYIEKVISQNSLSLNV